MPKVTELVGLGVRIQPWWNDPTIPSSTKQSDSQRRGKIIIPERSTALHLKNYSYSGAGLARVGRVRETTAPDPSCPIRIVLPDSFG